LPLKDLKKVVEIILSGRRGAGDLKNEEEREIVYAAKIFEFMI